MTNDMNTPTEGGVGYLRFSVGTAGNTIPVRDALVYVYTDPEDDSEGQLLYSLTTNEDGITETVELPTPPLSDSFFPEGPRPYSTYNVYASKDGFYPAEGRTVPLFPGITSIQPINLIPLSEMPGTPAPMNGAAQERGTQS